MYKVVKSGYYDHDYDDYCIMETNAPDINAEFCVFQCKDVCTVAATRSRGREVKKKKEKKNWCPVAAMSDTVQ